jgi:hypothetical protein
VDRFLADRAVRQTVQQQYLVPSAAIATVHVAFAEWAKRQFCRYYGM